MKIVPLLTCFALATVAFAQDKATPQGPIVTDRPDFTESANVVPLRWLQFESGFTYQGIRGGSSISGPEALIRYGMAPRSELRIGIPDYGRLVLLGNSEVGFADGSLGFKFETEKPVLGFDVAVIVETSIPTRGAFSSDSSEPAVKLCYARDFSSGWSLSAMSVGVWTKDDGNRTILQQTVALARELSGGLGFFIEYAGTYHKSMKSEHVAHGGFAYQLSNDRQIDLHFGTSLSGNDRMPFIGVGYAVRF
ncbi:MAG: transporter [Fimbriimonadaceae bacterium]|nr:transporter [Fimbriimonadaceae bacterium]